MASYSAGPTLRLRYNYIHAEILKLPNYPVVFNKLSRPCIPTRPNSNKEYEACVQTAAMPVGDGNVGSKLILKHFQPPVRATHMRLPEEEKNFSGYPVQLRNDFRDDIHQRLSDCLVWLHSKGLSARLEGRFGKLLWPDNVVDEGNMDVARFLMVAKEMSWFEQTQFKVGIHHKSPQILEKTIKLLGRETTYMLAIESKKSDDFEAFNIRIRFDGGKPTIIHAENGRKTRRLLVHFDILCLHRMHDMRISLCSVQEADAHMLQKLEKYLTFAIKKLETGAIRYDPQSSEKWHVSFIRHKEVESYDLDGKHTVNVSSIRECHINPDEPCEIKLEDCTQHHEVELHFADLASASQWDPTATIEEVKSGAFLKAMDELNKDLEEMQ